MREATNEAEDIIELLLSDSLLESSPNLDELERVTLEIEAITTAVKERHREGVGGFNDDTMEIVSRLCTGQSGLEIVPIVGTGGIGKTTLARNAYDNPLTVDHFEIRGWVTISLDYSRRETVFNLLGSMHKYNAENISNNSEEELIQSVYQVLFGRRYLLVLDDVWSEEYLENLVERSVVSVRKRKSNGGRIKSFSIHGLMRDMCVRQAYADNFYLHFRRFPLPADALRLQRRLSIFNYNDDGSGSGSCSTNRSVICFEGNREGVLNWLRYFTLLRILSLSNTFDVFEKHDLPDHVFELFHLRYLALGYPFSIPKAISHLENLQTLIIRPSKNFRVFLELPVEIWRMRQLRHVVVHSCVLPRQQEEEEEEESMSALENLQTLTEAVDFICSKERLRMIPNLKKLCILYVGSRDSEDYELHNLVHLQKLEILKIEMHAPLKQLRLTSAFRPTTVRKLSLSGVGIPWEDMNIVASLPNLRVLKLRNHACVGDTWETNGGGFSQLKFLLIGKSELVHWMSETSHFPRLKCVVLHHCRRLREVPNEIGEIPTLKLIEVDDCNKSLLNSIKRIKEDQLSLGNDSLQVLFFRYYDSFL